MLRDIATETNTLNPFSHLKSDDVHVWLFLNDDQTKKNSKINKLLKSEYKKRLIYLITKYFHIHEEEVDIRKDEFGKPFLYYPTPVFFSLSHTKNDQVIALSLTRPIGIDIEHYSREVAYEAIIKRCFSREEEKVLHTDSEENRKKTFLRYWVLKESTIKVWGRGLATDLHRSSIQQISDDYWLIGEGEDRCLGKVFELEGRVIGISSLERLGKFRVSFFTELGLNNYQ